MRCGANVGPNPVHVVVKPPAASVQPIGELAATVDAESSFTSVPPPCTLVCGCDPPTTSVVTAGVFGVVEPIAPGIAQSKPCTWSTLRFTTLVVDAMTNGAVPVASVEVSCPERVSEPAESAGPVPVMAGPIAVALVPFQINSWVVTWLMPRPIGAPPIEFDGHVKVWPPAPSCVI